MDEHIWAAESMYQGGVRGGRRKSGHILADLLVGLEF